MQYELYKCIKEEMRAVVVKNGMPEEDNAEDLLKRLLRLVQVASNPILIDESYKNIPGKYEYLIDLVNSIIDSNEKCIIWTNFIENVNWLHKSLKQYGTVKVHGQMNIEDRNKAIDKFKLQPEIKILIATPASSKEGLTLTVANHVIFYDRNFSLDDYLQSQDRIHRISQQKTCYIHNLIMKDSIDEWIDALLQSKHLAAQLSQGDIDLTQFINMMSYKFGDIVNEILNL